MTIKRGMLRVALGTVTIVGLFVTVSGTTAAALRAAAPDVACDCLNPSDCKGPGHWDCSSSTSCVPGPCDAGICGGRCVEVPAR